jgi:hypothetical protein
MTNPPEQLFREEAIQYLVHQADPSDPPRVSTWWTTAAFWLLLVLTAVGITLALVIQVHDESLLHFLVGHP